MGISQPPLGQITWPRNRFVARDYCYIQSHQSEAWFPWVLVVCCTHHIKIRHCNAFWSHCSVMVPLTGTTFQQTWSIFLFSLSYLIISDFEPWGELPTGTHLLHTIHHLTNMCLSHGEPCFIKPNLIFDSSFPCCAWLCCHMHALPSCLCFSSILPVPCDCIMLFISAMPTLDSISRFNTNMYILYANMYIKTKELTGNPSLILLEFPL